MKWTEYFESMLMLMVMAALLRASYELAGPKPVLSEVEGPDNPGAGVDSNIAQLAPQQREWAEKAAKRYAEAQERKWRRWNEAMFEAK